MPDAETKLKNLLDYQQSVIQDFDQQFQRFDGERREKKKKVEVLRHYEKNRSETWTRIRKNHVKLIKNFDLPDFYVQAYDSVTATNDEFKNRLVAIANEQKISLEVNDDEPSESEDEEESDKYKSVPPKTDGDKYDASNKGEIPSTSNGQTESQPDNKSDSLPKGYVPPHAGTPYNNENIHGAASMPDLRDKIGSTPKATTEPKTHKNAENSGNFHANSTMNNPTASAGIGDAMTAIVQLVSQQFALMQNQMNNQHDNQSHTTSMIQEQFQALHTQMTNNYAEKSSLKPQQLEIAPFSGDILEYKSFKEIFMTAISKTKWGNLEKLLLLQSKLTGRALDRVKHLAKEEQNYEIMWSILDKEFLVERAIIQHNVRNLMQIQPVKHNDVNALRQFYSTLNTVIRNLTQLNDVTPADWIFEIGYTNLDEKTKRRFEDYIRAKELKANVQTVTEFLMMECNLLEVQLGQNNSKSLVSSKYKESANDVNKQKQNKSTHAHVTNDTTMQAPNDTRHKCFICKNDHELQKCPTLLAADDREKLLRHYKLCIYCLKHKFNYQNPCRAKDTVRCDKCGFNHHTLLHPLNSTTNFSTRSHECQEFSHMTEQATHNFVTKNDELCTLLPTAIANVVAKNGMTVPISCLVDSCAQRSYVSEQTVQALSLKKYKTNVIIKGINDILGTAKSYVNLIIKLDDPQIGLITTKALVVNKIASNIPTIEVDKSIFGDKKLANPHLFSGIACEVGILLGSDILSRIFKAGGGTEVTSSGLLMQETHLGWIVSGKNLKPQQTVSSFITYNESATKCLSDSQLNDKILKSFEVPDEEIEVDDEEDNTPLGHSPKQTLGLNFDPIKDELSLNNHNPTEMIYTKQGLSSIVAKTFDLLNFALPYIMMLRIFLQQLWTTKIDWDDDKWKLKFDAEINEELNGTTSTFLSTHVEKEEDMFARFSSFNRLVHAVCYMRRWMTYKRKLNEQNDKIPIPLSADEITTARKTIIKYYQHRELSSVIERVKDGKLVPKHHYSHKLSPKLDEDGILRLQGRLQNARYLPINQTQPIIIPKCHLLDQLLTFIHLSNFHPKPIKTTENGNQISDTPLKHRFRSRTKNITLTQVLITCLALTTITQAQLTKLHPGIHLHKIGSAQIQSTIIPVTILTSVSPSADQTIINNMIKNFTNACMTMTSETQNYCNQWTEIINLEAERVSQVMNQGNLRPKRSFLSAIGKFTAYAAPHLLTGGLMVYQQSELNDLQHALTDSKIKLHEATGVVKQMNNQLTKMTDAKFTQLSNIQENLELKNKIQNDAQQMMDVLYLTASKYEDLWNSKPYDLLKEVISKNKTRFQLKFPVLKDPLDLFVITKKEKIMIDSKIAFIFHIPMMSTTEYRQLAIISIPTEARQVTVLNNSPKLVNTIIISNDNETFGYQHEMTQLLDDIYSHENLQQTTDCIKTLLHGTPNHCENIQVAEKVDELMSLGEDNVLIINELNKTEIICENNSIATKNQWMTGTIFKLPKSCTIKTPHHVFISPSETIAELNATTNVKDIIVKYPISHTNFTFIDKYFQEVTADLSKQLEATTAIETQNGFAVQEYIRYIIMIAIFCVLILSFLCYQCLKNAKTAQITQESTIKWSDIYSAIHSSSRNQE